jgi:hypothetical protein
MVIMIKIGKAAITGRSGWVGVEKSNMVL